MCLSKCKEIVPEESIVVYKFLEEINSNSEYYSGCGLRSPYYRYYYKIGERCDITENEPYNVYNWLGDNIEGGAFHSFANLADVVKDCVDYIDDDREWTESFMNDGNKFAIVKCTIPKDSRHVWEGKYYNRPAYASTSLIVDEIVTDDWKEIRQMCEDIFPDE